jgi:hypothetical protein
MNTIITLEDPYSADFDPNLHRNMNDALAVLRKQLELFEPEALRLFKMFPFLRVDELLGHAQRDLDRVQAPLSERMAGLREVKSDLKELLVAFWQRDGGKLFVPLLGIGGLAVMAVGVCAGALSLLP